MLNRSASGIFIYFAFATVIACAGFFTFGLAGSLIGYMLALLVAIAFLIRRILDL